MILVDMIKYLLKTPYADMCIDWAQYQELKNYRMAVRSKMVAARRALISDAGSTQGRGCITYKWVVPKLSYPFDLSDGQPYLMECRCENLSDRADGVCLKYNCPFLATNHDYYAKLNHYNAIRHRCRTFWRDKLNNRHI